MVSFNSDAFEVIISEESLTLYGVENKKVYFFNATGQFIFKKVVEGSSIEEIVLDFCKNTSFDIDIVRNDFEKTLDFLLRERIFLQ